MELSPLSTILHCFITYIMNIVCIGKNNLVEISKHSGRYRNNFVEIVFCIIILMHNYFNVLNYF